MALRYLAICPTLPFQLTEYSINCSYMSKLDGNKAKAKARTLAISSYILKHCAIEISPL